jgi:hypothetical protein
MSVRSAVICSKQVLVGSFPTTGRRVPQEGCNAAEDGGLVAGLPSCRLGKKRLTRGMNDSEGQEGAGEEVSIPACDLENVEGSNSGMSRSGIALSWRDLAS